MKKYIDGNLVELSQDEESEVIDRVASLTPTLDEYKEKSCKLIDKIRFTRSLSGIPFTTTTSPTAGSHNFADSVNDISAIKTATSDIKVHGISMLDATGGYWRSNNGVDVQMSEAEFFSLGVTISTFLGRLSRESHNVKNRINLATDKQTIENEIADYQAYDPLA